MHHPLVLKIKYAKPLPIFMLFASIFTIFFRLLYLGISLSIFSLSIVILISLLMLRVPLIEITRTEIRKKNFLGHTANIYLYTPDSINFEKNTVYINNNFIFNTWWTDTDTNKIRYFIENV